MSKRKWSGLAKQRQGQLGVNAVERVVLQEWASRWQSVDAHNDDGVDGLIFLERSGNLTGQIIYVQVKCHQIVPVDNRIRVQLPKTQGEKPTDPWRRWERLIGAAILVHVDPATLDSHWIDLQGLPSSQEAVDVPLAQKFDRDARHTIAKLCGTLHRDVVAKKVQTTASDFPHLRSCDHIQPASRQFYRELREIRIGDSDYQVIFTREGWRHITRPKRPELTRFQSFVLLGVIRPLLAAMSPSDLKMQPTPHVKTLDEYFILKALVVFPFRQASVVKIVLHRAPTDEPNHFRFHTIYEPRRRKAIAGK
ncbi:DUF4365 domain-containing protein [Rhizobium leguminosarum bv. viciae]|uniref:DUF4365 domain-containing protein n=1 Tax=Rhizobium leguminosarum TaxID=384 RepID=UPI001441E04C|nr:DUF4365 domain-containing protein [Rhizobium leguminosarum]NKL05604.1 DUF4365 domain-containing protein [Rhizobium leguminosarum bv. viciae]